MSFFQRSLIAKRVPFITGLLLLVSLTGIAGFSAHRVLAADCDNNAIIHCGETTSSAFISQVKKNDSLNGHHDLQAIYAAYGLEPASYDKFVTSARMGTAYKNGNIVVDNQIVATNAKSIGRLASSQGAGYFTQNIAGTNYYGNDDAHAFASDSIPVMVMFDATGTMQFAVLTSCSNPMSGSKVVSTYSCDLLQKTAVAGKANTYTFTTAASRSGNATIVKYVYNFGDGTTATTTTGGAPVTHTYTKAGSFTATVSVYVNLPGNQQVTVTSAKCSTVIKVVMPFYECLQLTGAFIDKAKMSFSFVATAQFGNGATFTGADFDFGDGTSQSGVSPNGNTATTSHIYSKAGDYNVSALLHFMSNGQPVTAAACKALVTPTQPPTPECKPGVPLGSPACTPCQFNAALPSNSPQCQPPVLPNTGAGNVVAMFAVVVVGGFLVYRQLIFRKHRAAFMAAQDGTSPLPLGQPLDSAPLAGTPLARKAKSLRRKRPF